MWPIRQVQVEDTDRDDEGKNRQDDKDTESAYMLGCLLAALRALSCSPV